MKVIEYQYLSAVVEYPVIVDGVETIETKDVVIGKIIPYTAENEEIVKKEAYNGEYEIYDDGKVAEPTAEEMFNALLGVTE